MYDGFPAGLSEDRSETGSPHGGNRPAEWIEVWKPIPVDEGEAALRSSEELPNVLGRHT